MIEKDAQPVLIIAEAGVNHNGNMDMARELIQVAADAGADYIKFQTFSADHLVGLDAKKAEYQQITTGADETQHAMLKKLELDDSMHENLRAESKRSGVRFLSTAFDQESLDYLVRTGIDFIKIPSGELTNLPYVRYVGGLGIQVILSTGMATLSEIENTIAWLCKAGLDRNKISILHCTTAYPANFSDINLRVIQSMQAAFGLPVGYSDHTTGIEAAIAAVALGACIIEKHFTLDKTLPGPDHQASLKPAELKQMVQAIRNIEKGLGNGVKLPTAVELKNRKVARKQIVATRKIKKGQPFTEDILATKRPLEGLGAEHWDLLLGQVALRDFAVGEKIEWSQVPAKN